MPLEEMKARIRQVGEEAWSKGNLDALDDVYAAEYVWQRPPLPALHGLEAAKANIIDTRSRYFDIHIHYEEMIGQGNTIAYTYTWQAKHIGLSSPSPLSPFVKEVSLKGCVVLHLVDGMVVEELEFSDYMGFLEQMGATAALA